MAEAQNPDAWRGTLHRRLIAISALFVVWGIGIQARLVHLQVFRHEEFVSKAERQHMRTLTVPALRGDIVDRDNRVLATSASVDTIYAVPSEIDDPQQAAAAICHALAQCSKDDQKDLIERLTKKRPFQYVRRHVSPDEAKRVRALALDGIGFMAESHRFYPNRNLLGPILGYVGLDNKGLGGLEQSYNSVIRGADGKVIVVTDAKKKAFDRIERPPSAGASIELTIDSVLQHEVERELAAGISENRAEGGVAIVMDPWTGEILAMASEPAFNPNVFGKIDPDLRHNRAVESIYEPGSTFKTVTASAALEEKVLTPDTLIDCAPGYIDVGARRVHDTHHYGTLTFTDVIVKSSNVGAIRAGFRIGPERLERYVRRFGFGSRLLEQQLPAESPGIVWSKLSDDALTSVSMGYQVGVTPLQMATAVSSIANGGVLMRPRLVRATIRNGVRQRVAPLALRRTVNSETASTLTTIMEGVVERGTAKAAQIDGYTIAGKTGTSAKLVDGQYLEVAVHVVVRRLLPVAQAGADGARRHRYAAQRRLLWWRGVGAGLQAYRRGRDSPRRHSPHHRPGSPRRDRSRLPGERDQAGDLRVAVACLGAADAGRVDAGPARAERAGGGTHPGACRPGASTQGRRIRHRAIARGRLAAGSRRLGGFAARAPSAGAG